MNMKFFKLSITLLLVPAFIATLGSFKISFADDNSTLTPSSQLANPKKKNKKKKEKEEDNNHLSEKGNRKLTPTAFPYPESLKPAVEFWKKIYAEYDKDQSAIHDTRYFVIYSVVNFNQPDTEDDDISIPKSTRKSKISEEKKRILSILEMLAAGGYDPKTLTGEEARIYHLFDKIEDSNKFANASNPDRIRSQRGQKDKFLTAIPNSGKYLTEIENILISQGVPWEISRLPFVESMYNLQARSSVGASGIWQFMPYTGKIYMTVNGNLDERNDPIDATYAAAALLKANYEQLGNWALAINAYNSGLQTLMNAKAATGTDDIGTIIQTYEGGVYKFASRNFYPCFLAVLEISNRYKNYFGEMPRAPLMQYDTVTIDNTIKLSELASATGVDLETLREMNPAYHSSFFYGTKACPAGYKIKIPKNTQEKFAQALKEIQEKKIPLAAIAKE